MTDTYKEEFIDSLVDQLPSDTEIEDEFPSVGNEINDNENLANLYRQQGIQWLRDKIITFIEQNK